MSWARQPNGAYSWSGDGEPNGTPFNMTGSTGSGFFTPGPPGTGGSAVSPPPTTTPTTTGPTMYQPINTQAPLGTFDYRTNVMGQDGTSQTANSDPSQASQFAGNYLRPGLNMAQSFLNQGVGFNPYTGQRVAGFNPQQSAYFEGVNQSFGQPAGYMQTAQNTIGNVANSNGIAPGMAGNLNTLDAISGGQNAIGTGGQFQTQANNPLAAMQQQAGQFYGQAQQGFGPSYSERNLSGVASGGGANPYFQDQLADQLDQVRARINAQMSAGGRTGSAAASNALARGLGATATDALSRNYEFEAGRQLQANALMDQQRQQGIANQFTGAAGMANLGQNEIQNRMAALQALTGVQGQNIANQAGAAQAGMSGRLSAQQDALRAAALAPTIQQGEITRLNQLLNSGTIQQSQRQDELNAARDLYNEQQQAPWQRLNAYMSAIGQPQSGSIGPQPAGPAGPSTAQSVLGGALGGASLGGMLGFNPLLGAVGGGILGGLF